MEPQRQRTKNCSKWGLGTFTFILLVLSCTPGPKSRLYLQCFTVLSLKHFIMFSKICLNLQSFSASVPLLVIFPSSVHFLFLLWKNGYRTLQHKHIYRLPALNSTSQITCLSNLDYTVGALCVCVCLCVQTLGDCRCFQNLWVCSRVGGFLLPRRIWRLLPLSPSTQDLVSSLSLVFLLQIPCSFSQPSKSFVCFMPSSAPILSPPHILLLPFFPLLFLLTILPFIFCLSNPITVSNLLSQAASVFLSLIDNFPPFKLRSFPVPTYHLVSSGIFLQFSPFFSRPNLFRLSHYSSTEPLGPQGGGSG